jgi:2',3'-cyclic-nucleotide 2'-phosphodiesterase (5'-nucleotidase family)
MATPNHNLRKKKALRCARIGALPCFFRHALSLSILGICLVAAAQIVWATDTSRSLTIFYTNDVRGNIDSCGCAKEQLGDISTRAAVLRSFLTREKNAIVLDSGDAFSDESLFNTFDRARRDLIVEAMGNMGYNYLNVGDTELGFDLSVLKDIRDKARFKLLSANILDQSSGNPIFSPYALHPVGDVKVVLIGLVTDRIPKRIPPGHLQGLTFADPIVTARNYVSNLKDQSDLMIVVAHLGLEQEKELAQAVPEIDIIIGGHSGQKLSSPIKIGKTLIMEGGDQGQYVGKLTVKLNEVKGISSYEYELVPVDALRFQADQHVQKLRKAYQEKEKTGNIYDQRDRRKSLTFSLEGSPKSKEKE